MWATYYNYYREIILSKLQILHGNLNYVTVSIMYYSDEYFPTGVKYISLFPNTESSQQALQIILKMT